MFRFGWNQRKRFAPSRSGPVGKRAKPGVNAKVAKLQRQVALLRPEVKEHALTMSQSNITQAAGYIHHISNLIQGNADGDRVGDQVRPQKIRVRLVFSDAAAVTCARFLIVKDKAPNGAYPTIGSAADSIFYNFYAVHGQPNNASKKRFTVLWDSAHNGLEATLATRSGGILDSGYIKLSGVTTYINTAGTVADAGLNHYFLVALVDGADTLDLNAISNFCFTDV